MARMFKAIKAAAEKGDTGAFSQFSQRYVEWGGQVTQPAKQEEKEEAYSGWTLGSLAFVMGYPLESHAPLPEWCNDPLPDAVRDAAEAANKPVKRAAAVAAISSENYSRPEDHMASRAYHFFNNIESRNFVVLVDHLIPICNSNVNRVESFKTGSKSLTLPRWLRLRRPWRTSTFSTIRQYLNFS